MNELYNFIKNIPDFPKKGIMFKDITPLLKDAAAFRKAVKLLANEVPAGVSKIIAIESRGFIFGAAMAETLNKGFVPIRKTGKLPDTTKKYTYDLEYGTDTIEMHKNAVERNEEVVLIDDVLATGGTANAACKLIESCGGKISKVIFLIELKGLNGREKLKDYNVFSLLCM